MNCKSCVWYKHYVEIDGRCCRYPPVVKQQEDSREYVGRWPTCQSGDWCGEFKENNNAKP